MAPTAPRPPASGPTVGVLSDSTGPGTSPEGEQITALKDGFGSLDTSIGHIDVQARTAQQPDQLASLATELIGLGSRVVVVDTVAAAEAIRAAAPTLPVVFVNIRDPVGAGLVDNPRRPGGNATGLTAVSPRLSGKRLQLLRECLRRLSRLAVLRNPDEPGTALEYAATEAAAGALGLSLHGLEVRTDADIPLALEAAQAGRSEGLIVFDDPLLFGNRAQILGFALQRRWPTMFDHRAYVEQRGLMAYGPNPLDGWRRAAAYVDNILKGLKPADLPVEQPAKFELIINFSTAELIGLTIPHGVLLQATEIIQ